MNGAILEYSGVEERLGLLGHSSAVDVQLGMLGMTSPEICHNLFGVFGLFHIHIHTYIYINTGRKTFFPQINCIITLNVVLAAALLHQPKEGFSQTLTN